jgi:hypothetical protein
MNSRISKRIYIISILEDIIRESVYYRNNSFNLKKENRIVIASISNKESKAKIL